MCKRTARLHQEVQVAPEAPDEQSQWVAGLLLRDELRLHPTPVYENRLGVFEGLCSQSGPRLKSASTADRL